jgi:hypothetical protein
MMQTQWPGLGPNLDLSSLDAAAGTGRQLWPEPASRALAASQPADGIARSWWTCGTGGANGGDPLGGLFGGGSASFGNGSLIGLLTGLIGMLRQLVGTLPNQSGGGTSNPPHGGPQQAFEDVDVSSTGDPHLARTGTAEGPNGTRPVDVRWDSMTAHDDLVHSDQVEGGYRVSTAVTQPGANGTTFNQSATVHAGFDQDAVTMNRDGSYHVYDNGAELALGKGESADLSGGETVRVNQDGSLVVSATGANGGSIATTLRSTGAGVDVTAHAHEITLGGDAIAHGAPKAHHDPAHGGHNHRHPAPAAAG